MIELIRQRLLIIAPHPDDDVIGCGGLIQKVKEEGGHVFVLFLTVGDTKDFSKEGSSSAPSRKKEIERVAKYLSYDDYDIVFEGNDFHLKLDLLGQKSLIDKIERESRVSIEKIKPSIIAIPSSSSYNQDHRIAAVAAYAACRPANPSEKHFVPTVLSYEQMADTWSINDQKLPILFVSLTKKQVDSKIAAMRFYKSQVRPFPNLRSLKSLKILAALRGAQAATDYAEAFGVERIVV